MKLFSVWLCLPSQGCYGYLSRSLAASCSFLSLLRYFSHNHLLAMVQPVLDMKFKSISRVNKSITTSNRFLAVSNSCFSAFSEHSFCKCLKRNSACLSMVVFFLFRSVFIHLFTLPFPFHYMSINRVWTGAWTGLQVGRRGRLVWIGSHGTVHCLGAGWSQWTTSTKQGTHLWSIAMQLIILHYCMCKEFPLLLWVMAT